MWEQIWWLLWVMMTIVLQFYLREKYPKRVKWHNWSYVPLCNKGRILFHSTVFLSQSLDKSKGTVNQTHTWKTYLLKYNKVTVQLRENQVKEGYQRGFGPSPTFVQVLHDRLLQNIKHRWLAKDKHGATAKSYIKKNKTAKLHKLFTYFRSVHNGYITSISLSNLHNYI